MARPRIASDNGSSHLLSCPLGWIADPSHVAPSPPGLLGTPSRALSFARRQARLFCPCGDTRLLASGLCSRCYSRQAHSRLRFAGYRDRVLARDGRRCRGCGSKQKLAVHHRRPGVHHPRFLITLCAACHARIHRLQAVRHWVEPALVPLWREQHPEVPVQLQFVWDGIA
jgi:hypothetical protein